jgi:hypothetical protein
MGWETRRNGRCYYYRKERQGGRVVSTYYGTRDRAALIAELAALDQERRAQERREARIVRDRFADEARTLSELDAYRAVVAETVVGVFEALGFKKHKRQWRLQRMTEQAAAGAGDAFALARTIYRKKKPTPDDISRFRQMLDEHTRLAAVFGDQALMARLAMLPDRNAQPIIRAAIDARCTAIAHDLGAAGSTELERLLIDEVVLCWLDQYRIAMAYGRQVGEGDTSLSALEQWEHVLTSKQARYLRAIETLARVRRLLRLPTLQVNVALDGGQQVNVAGEMHT